jgi:hypothetical protein
LAFSLAVLFIQVTEFRVEVVSFAYHVFVGFLELLDGCLDLVGLDITPSGPSGDGSSGNSSSVTSSILVA